MSTTTVLVPPPVPGTDDSGSGGSGSKGSDSANGSSGATSNSRSGSSIIEGHPAAGANHDPSLAIPCPVGGSIHPISSDMSSSTTSMIQDATIDHRNTGNEGEDVLEFIRESDGLSIQLQIHVNNFGIL